MSEEEIQEWGTAFEEMIRDPYSWSKGRAAYGDQWHQHILAAAAKSWMESAVRAKEAQLAEWMLAKGITDFDKFIRWFHEEFMEPWLDHLEDWDTLEGRVAELEEKMQVLAKANADLLAELSEKHCQNIVVVENTPAKG